MAQSVQEPSSELLTMLGGFTISDVDVSEFGTADVETVLAEVRRVQRGLDGLVMRLGARTTELAAAGRSGSSEETLRGAGGVGSRQARREAARAGMAVELPELAAAVLAGATSGEHVDSVVRHLSKVPEVDRKDLPLEEIVAKAAQLPVETFDRFMRRQVDGVVGVRLADAAAKREASEFRHWFDDRSGMGRFTGALDPERFEVLVNAVEQKTVELAGRDNRSRTATWLQLRRWN